MKRKLARGLIFEMDMLVSDFISSPLKYQLIVIGKSPFGTVHATCKVSPSLRGFSPNENGMISGRAASVRKLHLRRINNSLYEGIKEILET